MIQFWLYYIYTLKCHRKLPVLLSYTNKHVFFLSFSKSENKQVEQVLPGGGGWYQWRQEVGKCCMRMKIAQILCTHVCNWKNETCRNYSRNGGKGKRRMIEGVNSTIIYLMYCRNFWQCHNIPPANTTIKIAVF
jgi:hypothetical protein